MLFLFLMLVTVTGVLGNVECDYLTVLNEGEVKELLNPSYPFNDGPGMRCRWSYIADEDRRIILVCPFNEGSDKRTDKRDSCGAEMQVSSDAVTPVLPVEDRVVRYCRDLTFGVVGLNNRMNIFYENTASSHYNLSSGFKCYVYAELKSRWDPINVQHRKDLEGYNPGEECDFHIKLMKNEIVRLVTGKYAGEGWQKCRWRAVVPRGSQISLTCPFTDKPPEPLTAQVVPCDSDFVVTTTSFTKRFSCNVKSFSISSTKHVISLLYETNLKVPYEQFECYFHWKSPDNDTSISQTKPLPYRSCDHYLELNGTDFVESEHYPGDIPAGKICRITVEVPENHRILLNCLSPKKPREVVSEAHMNCRGEFHIDLAGGKYSHHCQETGFFKYSRTNWMIIRYHSLPNDPVEGFRCFLSMEPMKSESECVHCSDIEKLKFTSCDNSIALTDVGESENLTITESSVACRWSINFPKDTQVFLSCPIPPEVEANAVCEDYFTVYPTGELSSGVVYCADVPFSIHSSSYFLIMIVTYHSKTNSAKTPFNCTVTAYYDKCDRHITLPRLKHYQSVPLKTPYWPTASPPWERCTWHYESAPEYFIHLYCGNFQNKHDDCNRTAFISKTGDEDFRDGIFRCLTVNFDEVSVSNQLSIRYEDLTEDSKPTEYFGCSVYLDEKRPGLCDCGWSPTNFPPRTRRIEGAHNALQNEYPMMAALLNLKNGRYLFCGATIISDRYALTAARCLAEAEKERYEIGLLVGTNDVTEDKEHTIVYHVDKNISHPNFNDVHDTIHTSDIGLVHVTETIRFNLYVKPVCLPFMNRHNKFVDEKVKILGWGMAEQEVDEVIYKKVFQNFLRKTDAMIKDDSKCTAFQNNYPDSEHICVQHLDSSVCQADSGGPVLWKDPKTERLQLIGILFKSHGCVGHYSKQTEVAHFLDWISENTPGAEFCTNDIFAEHNY